MQDLHRCRSVGKYISMHTCHCGTLHSYAYMLALVQYIYNIYAYLKASKLSSSRELGVEYNPNCFDSVFCMAGVLPLIILWHSKLCCLVRNSPITLGEALSVCIHTNGYNHTPIHMPVYNVLGICNIGIPSTSG